MQLCGVGLKAPGAVQLHLLLVLQGGGGAVGGDGGDAGVGQQVRLAEGRLEGRGQGPAGPRPGPPLVSRWKVACLPAPQQRRKVARKEWTSASLVWNMVLVAEGITVGAKLPPPRPSWRWSL